MNIGGQGGQADSSGQADRADSKPYKNTHHQRTPHRGKFFFFFYLYRADRRTHRSTPLSICLLISTIMIPPRSKPSAIRTRGGRGPLDIGAAIRAPPPPCTKTGVLFRACAGEKSQKARKQHAKRQGKPANCLSSAAKAPRGQLEALRQTAAPPEQLEALRQTAAPPEQMEALRQIVHRRTAGSPPADRRAARTAGSPPAADAPPEPMEATPAADAPPEPMEALRQIVHRADRRRNALYNVDFRAIFPGG